MKSTAEKTTKTPPTRAREAVPASKAWRSAKRDKDTLARLAKVIDLLKIHGIVAVACRQAIVAGRGLSKRTYYEMRANHPDFADEVEEAISQAVEELEASGMACARLAQKDPRYLPMLKFALQVKAGWLPRQRIEHSGPGGGPIPTDVSVKGDIDKLSAKELEAAYRRKLAERGLAS